MPIYRNKMTYIQKTEYKWVKSKKIIDGIEAQNTFSALLSPEWYAKNTLIYIIDEKQVYRARHIKKIERVD